MDTAMVGKRLGRASRDVFEYGTDAVIKFACPSKRSIASQNLAEYRAWQRVKDTDAARLFVSVLECAEDGSWLVMQRVKPLHHVGIARVDAIEMMTRQYGLLVGDLDSDNLGEHEGRTVILDYGIWYDSTIWDETGTFCRSCQYCQEMVW